MLSADVVGEYNCGDTLRQYSSPNRIGVCSESGPLQFKMDIIVHRDRYHATQQFSTRVQTSVGRASGNLFLWLTRPSRNSCFRQWAAIRLSG